MLRFHDSFLSHTRHEARRGRGSRARRGQRCSGTKAEGSRPRQLSRLAKRVVHVPRDVRALRGEKGSGRGLFYTAARCKVKVPKIAGARRAQHLGSRVYLTSVPSFQVFGSLKKICDAHGGRGRGGAERVRLGSRRRRRFRGGREIEGFKWAPPTDTLLDENEHLI